MAHNKVYGTCENLCKVEVPSKAEYDLTKIVDEGSSGIWHYIKTAGGTAICFCKTSSGTPTTVSDEAAETPNIVWQSNQMSLAFPTGLFSNIPHVSIEVQQGGVFLLKATGSTTKNTLWYEMLRFNNRKESVDMTVFAIGRWNT